MGAEAIRDRWLAEGVSLRPGLPDAAIDASERSLGVRSPGAFRRFYRLMDGMADGQSDSAWNAFWPLVEVGSAPDKLADAPRSFAGLRRLHDAEEYFVFADHSIWLWVYAVRLTGDADDPGPVIRLGDSDHLVAPSFEEFLNRSAADPDSIL